jgi:hypothetical protein
MKQNRKIQLILLSLLFATSLYAQVSIGSLLTPDPAVLLQIKEREASDGGATADRGILLPRVELNSLSDITVIANTTPNKNKIADLTGLLVYNVNTAGMEEGIYEWDGREWVALEVLSEEEGAYTEKALIQTNSLDENNTPTVSVGRFSFRFSTNKEAQCKLNAVPSGDETVGFHIGRFWQEINNYEHIGYAYDSKILTFTPSNFGWKNLHSTAMAREERWEVWLADAVMNKVYNVRFIIYTRVAAPTYIVLVTEY